MPERLPSIQIGKQGVTENFLETLKTYFTKYGNVKVSVLKSAGHDKKQVKEYNQQILQALGPKFTSRTLGFTIMLKKWRRAVSRAR